MECAAGLMRIDWLYMWNATFNASLGKWYSRDQPAKLAPVSAIASRVEKITPLQQTLGLSHDTAVPTLVQVSTREDFNGFYTRAGWNLCPASVLYSLVLIWGLSRRLCPGLLPSDRRSHCSGGPQEAEARRVFTGIKPPENLDPGTYWDRLESLPRRTNVNFLLWHQSLQKLHLGACAAMYLVCKFIPGHSRGTGWLLRVGLLKTCADFQHIYIHCFSVAPLREKITEGNWTKQLEEWSDKVCF